MKDLEVSLYFHTADFVSVEVHLILEMLLICIVNTVETRLSNAEDFAFKLLLAKVLISGAVENNLASLMN